jgi:hypothetical protein
MAASTELFSRSAGDGGIFGIEISPVGLANALTQTDPKAVVLAYSWIDDSATGLDASLSEAYTALDGTRLADALELVLPTDFHTDNGVLHLIGNSHGAKVVTVATDVLDHVGNPNFVVAQLTLLDSPEVNAQAYRDGVRAGDVANNLWYYLGAINPSQTLVQNYISALDGPIGRIQGVNPFDTSQTNDFLQQVTDVTLDGWRLFDPFNVGGTFGKMHAYAYNWYNGAIVKGVINPINGAIDQATPSTPAVSYKGPTGLWRPNRQFVLTATGPNTVSEESTFTDLPVSGTTLTENGNSTATFTENFRPVNNLAGISFNYQFTQPGNGDQLVISVKGPLPFQTYQIRYVMTGSVAGTSEGFGTLSLTSLAIWAGLPLNCSIQIQLFAPSSGSTGASVTITNMQQFTVPQSSTLGATPPGHWR